MKTTLTTALFTFCFFLNLATAFAGNKPKKAPKERSSKAFSQVLKTDNLRIMSLELAPGEFLDFHASPEQEAYAASEGTLRMVTPNGQEKIMKVKAGDRLFLDLTNFKNWNAGAKNLKIMLLEQSTELVEKKSIFSFYSIKP